MTVTSGLHADASGVNVHTPFAWTYADITAREAAAGFVAADEGKLAWQLDDDSVWILNDYAGPTWAQVSGGVARSGSTTDEHLAVWNGSDADSLKDGGAVGASGVARSGSTTDEHLAVWNGSDADSLKDGGAVGAGGGAATTDHFIVGQGGEGDTDLSAKIVIPNLSASPDIRVAGANDDEFDTTDTSDPLTGWTTLGAPTAHDINNTIKSHYYLNKSAASGVSFVGIYKAMTPAFTVTARISGITSRSNYNTGGLFIAEAAPGKMDMIEVIFSGDNYKLQAEQFSSPTGSSSPFFSATGSGVGLPPAYFRIVVHSSTNIDYYASPDGLIYNPLAIARNPGFTVAVVGFAVSTTGTGNAVQMAVDWIRFS